MKYLAAAIAPSTVSCSIAAGRSGGSTSGLSDGSSLGSSAPSSVLPSLTGSVDCGVCDTGAVGASSPSEGAQPTSASSPASAHTSRPRRRTIRRPCHNPPHSQHPLVDNLHRPPSPLPVQLEPRPGRLTAAGPSPPQASSPQL